MFCVIFQVVTLSVKEKLGTGTRVTQAPLWPRLDDGLPCYKNERFRISMMFCQDLSGEKLAECRIFNSSDHFT